MKQRLITREEIEQRLQYGRWMDVRKEAVLWFIDDPRYDTDMKFFLKKWQVAEKDRLGEKPNMKYRVRLKNSP